MSAQPIDLHWVQRAGQAIKTVLRPSTLEQALRMLADDPALRPLAGGTDLLLELDRTTDATPVSLVDLSGIAGFGGITGADGSRILLAGGVTHNDVIASAMVIDAALPLAQACLEVGSPQLRNRATIAGNLVTASPANDTISALMALDAEIVLSSWSDGSIAHRTVSISDFFTGFRTTAIEPAELISTITVPMLAPSARGVWAKLGLRKAQAISVVHGAVVVDLDDDGVVTNARLSLGSVAPTVVRVPQVEQLLVGQPLTEQVVSQAAELAASDVQPIDDGRATAAYRVDGVRVLVARCLQALADGEHASRWPSRSVRLSTRSPQAADRRAASEPRRTIIDDHSEITVSINGRAVSGSGAASSTLLDWVRDHASLGTKEGCAEGECGACTVLLDGDAVMSCLVAAAQADSAEVTTIEGLQRDGKLSEMQQQFVDSFAVQCGYCIPGFVMAASTLVDEVDQPTRDEIEFGLAGNLCRCTGYYPIVAAVERAAEIRGSR